MNMPFSELDMASHLLARRAGVLREEIAQAHARTPGQAPGAEVARDLEELHAIEQAQARLADGRYGLCTDCGEAMDVARLMAHPAALRCAACQGRAEHARVPLRSVVPVARAGAGPGHEPHGHDACSGGGPAQQAGCCGRCGGEPAPG